MEKLNITDLNLLKITRVRNWSISFDYDNKHYLLHGTSELDGGSWSELFEKTYDEKGKYHLEQIGATRSSEYVINDYLKKQKGKTIVYSQIDKEFFAFQLTYRKLATGIMEEKVKDVEKEQEKIQKKINYHKEKILELRKEFQNLLK